MPTTINPSDQVILLNNVQTGSANNLLNNVAPPATAGIPLVSTGGATQPSFTFASVSGGGTGNTSFTPFSLIAGGSTGTAALQNISGVGTSGQVLTSNGAGVLPTWQAAGGGFTPNATVQLFDDFVSIGLTTAGAAISIFGVLPWNNEPNSSFTPWARVVTASNAHPGILSNNSLTTGVPTANIALNGTDIMSSPLNSFILGGGVIIVNWVFNIVTASNSTNRYTLRMGMGDTANADQVNGVYFEYSDNINTGNWNYKSANSSTRTTNNSSTLVTTGWHNAQMTINAAASSVSFVMDGVSLGTAITTNIPTLVISPFLNVLWSAGTIAAGSVLIDLFYMTQTLTTPR